MDTSVSYLHRRSLVRVVNPVGKARAEAAEATGEQLDKLNVRIQDLQQQVQEAKEQKARALSRAQLTKSGHVYVISNIGSFGEQVYKIGMTRRLDPKERVHELSDASVPFPFDIHGMAYSENAPELENQFQRFFDEKRVNLVNARREFFQVDLVEIEQFAKKQASGLDSEKVRKLLMMLSPIVLGVLARRQFGGQNAQQADPEQLGGVLHQEAQTAAQQSPHVGGLLGKILGAVQSPRA